MEVRLQDVRRLLSFLALLAGPNTMSLTGNVWSYIRRTIRVAMSGKMTQVGYIQHRGNWMLSANNSSHAEMASAIEQFAANRFSPSRIHFWTIRTRTARYPKNCRI